MAYDRNRQRLVLFGGLTPDGPAGDTWEWDGEDWTQVSETGPAPRMFHTMDFDSSRNVVTLVGGQLQPPDPEHAAGAALNDTWDWNGEDWVQQEDAGPARTAHSTSYDDNRKRLVLFGGVDETAQERGDTWEWDGRAWTQRADFGPPPMQGASLVYTGSGCLLFGGASGNTPQRQTWTWDGTHWTARQDIGPSARYEHAAAYDSVRQRIVLFGGRLQAPTLLGDTWEQKVESVPTGGLTLTSFTMSDLTGTVVDNTGSGGTGTTVSVLSGTASFQLSAAAPANGSVITLSAPPESGLTLNLGVSVPAGQSAYQTPITTRMPAANVTSVEITAALENGNSLKQVVRVSTVVINQ